MLMVPKCVISGLYSTQYSIGGNFMRWEKVSTNVNFMLVKCT